MFIIQDTFIHLFVFVGFITISNCSVHSHGLLTIKSYTVPSIQENSAQELRGLALRIRGNGTQSD